MIDGIKVFDADGHLIEAFDLYERFLGPEYRKRVERIERPDSPMAIYRVDGSPMMMTPPETPASAPKPEYDKWSPENMERTFGEAARSGWAAKETAECLASGGVDISVVYGPGYDMWQGGIDPKLALEMSKAYCRWMSQYSEDSGGLIVGAAPVPLADIEMSLELVSFAYDLGMRAFWTRPSPIDGRTLGDRYYDPLYEALQDLDVPFATHTFSNANNLTVVGLDRGFHRLIDLHVCEHPMEAQLSLLAMLVNGVFDRFPRLRMAYLEAGSAWAPYWLDRIAGHVEVTRWREHGAIEHDVLDYFNRNIWLTTECDEKYLHHAVEALGDDRIMFPTDFPHPDAVWPGVVEEFLELPGVGLESKRKILWDNAVDFYRFDESIMPTFDGNPTTDGNGSG